MTDTTRGTYPDVIRVRAPCGLREAVATAAGLNNITSSELIRAAVLARLAKEGIKLRRGQVVEAT